MAKKNKQDVAPVEEVETSESEVPVEEVETSEVETSVAETAPAVEAPAESEAPKADVQEARKERKETKARKYNVPANPTLIEWPTDIWGLTKDLKRAFIEVASRINGYDDKKALVDEVLNVCQEHLEHKFEKDNQRRKADFAKAAEDSVETGEQLKLF